MRSAMLSTTSGPILPSSESTRSLLILSNTVFSSGPQVREPLSGLGPQFGVGVLALAVACNLAMASISVTTRRGLIDAAGSTKPWEEVGGPLVAHCGPFTGLCVFEEVSPFKVGKSTVSNGKSAKYLASCDEWSNFIRATANGLFI